MLPQPLPLPPGTFAAYLFDLDGTVADSMPLHYLAWTAAIHEAGGKFAEDTFYAWGGITPRRIVEMLNERDGLHMDPAAIVRRKEAVYLERLHEVQPVASVMEHIAAQRGHLPMAIVSGSPRVSVQRTLQALGIAEAFAAVVAAEDYTHGKPHPEPFLLAASLLGVAPKQCLVFEDADAGIRSAEAAGMQWVRVPQNYIAPEA